MPSAKVDRCRTPICTREQDSYRVELKERNAHTNNNIARPHTNTTKRNVRSEEKEPDEPEFKENQSSCSESLRKIYPNRSCAIMRKTNSLRKRRRTPVRGSTAKRKQTTPNNQNQRNRSIANAQARALSAKEKRKHERGRSKLRRGRETPILIATRSDMKRSASNARRSNETSTCGSYKRARMPREGKES